MASVISFVILATIGILILTALMPTIANQFIRNGSNASNTVINRGNVTGALYVVAILIPLMLLIGVIVRLYKYSGTGGG